MMPSKSMVTQDRYAMEEGVSMSNAQERQDNENYSKNFTRVPNILFVSYTKLTKEEKFLYCTLRQVYWDMKPRFVSLRDLSNLTGYSRGALANMLPRLHGCGLVHAEIRREQDKGNAKYHITIPDIWELNRQFFASSAEQQVAIDPSLNLVHQMDKSQTCPPNGQTCPPNEPSLSTKRAKPVHQTDKFSAMNEPAKPSDGTPKDSIKDISKDTLKEESTVDETATSPLAPIVATIPTLSSLSLFSEEETKAKLSTMEPTDPIGAPDPTPTQEKKVSSKKKKVETTEPKGPPVIPPVDAPWPSRETAVQIVEAKKGRIYSNITRKQELEEAGKILAMTVDDTPITREQFENAWDDMASSSWWEEHGKPCMIKYLRRDDTIVGIIKKLAKKGQPRTQTNAHQSKPQGSQQPAVSIRLPEEKRQRNLDRLRERAIASGYTE
jgi:hypothetical protein